MVSPQEVVSQLLATRLLEGPDPTALRIDPVKDVANRPVLAPGIECLQDDEQALFVFGVEPRLQRFDPLVQRRHCRFSLVFVGVPSGVVRINRAEIDPLSRLDTIAWIAWLRGCLSYGRRFRRHLRICCPP